MGGFGFIGFMINGIFLYLFAFYAFDNPDPTECWVDPRGTPQVTDLKPEEGRYVDFAA